MSKFEEKFVQISTLETCKKKTSGTHNLRRWDEAVISLARIRIHKYTKDGFSSLRRKKRFLQPTQSVGRLLQPTRSECLLKLCQSLTNFYPNLTSFSKNTKLLIPTPDHPGYYNFQNKHFFPKKIISFC